MGKDFKDLLLECGRYIDILDLLLNEIIFGTTDDNVVHEAYCFIDKLSRGEANDIDTKEYFNLYNYITKVTDIILHNFAIEVSHGETPNNTQIEKMKCFLILKNFFDNMTFFGSIYDWEIPIGWRKEVQSEKETAYVSRFINFIANFISDKDRWQINRTISASNSDSTIMYLSIYPIIEFYATQVGGLYYRNIFELDRTTHYVLTPSDLRKMTADEICKKASETFLELCREK